ncbi:sensor histidine kinase [Hymenobacter jejuensis]|uniref:histidine kinase n=1 Tax=Hymenobacter jejuensis TaxID=2502781 RepID=A0A5B8A6M0_9BACT|nr:ATP-binding protein [Hymenobacter jejuensis]QDA62002.1 cell wall metabolism sensor histidine kinase WalK [Hymenobacter jejuensis]
MSLKIKIRLSILTMLGLLLGLGAYAFFAIRNLERATHTLEQANFYSMLQGQQMLQALDLMETPATAPGGLTQFGRALIREARNITEPGEQALADSLAQNLSGFQRLLDHNAPLSEQTAKLQTLRKEAHRLDNLNAAAFETRMRRLSQKAADSRRAILLLMGLSALLGVSLVVRLPRVVVRPLRRLSAGIEHATNQGLSNGVPIEKHDEVGTVAQAFNRMLGQMQDLRSATRAELITERNRMESIVHSLDEGLLLVDQNRRIILANPVACALFEKPVEALVGRPAEEVAQESDLLRELLTPLNAPRPQEAVANLPLITIMRKGEETFYRVSVSNIVSFNEAVDKTEFAGYILSLRNVSDFKKLDQVKSNFLATVSHEFKTPLASINLSLKLLQDERTDVAERQRIASGIRQETQRLLRMVGELLDVARLDAGAGIKLNKQAVPLADVVRYATDTVRAQLDDKQLSLEAHLAPDLPTVRADVEKTTWVLINLLANAIRYSPLGERLMVRATLQEDMVQVSVQDCGPGIAAEHHERIFQRFAHIPNVSDHPGSSGLGLSISREFIAAQGGKLWVESAPGSGSNFHFTLPIVS